LEEAHGEDAAIAGVELEHIPKPKPDEEVDWESILGTEPITHDWEASGSCAASP